MAKQTLFKAKTVTLPTKTATQSVLAGSSKKEVVFEFYAPESKKVSVAGSFNDWNAAKSPLKKDSSGRWRLSLSLAPGRYEYRYPIDGHWENDQRPVACEPNPPARLNPIVDVAQGISPNLFFLLPKWCRLPRRVVSGTL